MQKKILIIVGTRPEAIKMVPVYNALKRDGHFTTTVLNSGQHSDMIDQVFDAFDWRPEHTLKIERETNEVSELYASLVSALHAALQRIKPDIVLVHGDTATTAAASMTAFLSRIKVAHVEAGLRSFNRAEPWPEEINRRVTDVVTDVYFAPTLSAKENLLREGVREQDIHVTGNTVVDALLAMSEKIETDAALARRLDEEFAFLDARRKLVLVTGHRRENFGENIRSVFAALKRIAQATDCQVLFPAHPHPVVQEEIKYSLSGTENIHVLPPLDYPQFIYLMKKCDLIISDSGGVQEEAPTFKKKVFVTRNVTERPEGIGSGFLEVVGCDEEKIVSRAKAVLSGASAMVDAPNPYGDGHAAMRIAEVLKAVLGVAASAAKEDTAAKSGEALLEVA